MIKCWSKFHIQILWYSFTRQNRFPLTPSQYFSGKQENPSSSASRHVNSSVCMYFFHDSEFFFSNLCIPPCMVAKKFQIHGVKITGKYTCESKNWICLPMVPSKTLLQVFIITTPGRRKLPISPKQSVLKIYLSSAGRAGL